MKDLLYFDPVNTKKRGQSYEQVDVWVNADVRKTEKFRDVAATANHLIDCSDKLIKAAQDLVAYLEGIDEAAVAQREIASVAMELRDIRNAADLIFQTAPKRTPTRPRCSARRTVAPIGSKRSCWTWATR